MSKKEGGFILIFDIFHFNTISSWLVSRAPARSIFQMEIYFPSVCTIAGRLLGSLIIFIQRSFHSFNFRPSSSHPNCVCSGRKGEKPSGASIRKQKAWSEQWKKRRAQSVRKSRADPTRLYFYCILMVSLKLSFSFDEFFCLCAFLAAATFRYVCTNPFRPKEVAVIMIFFSFF